MISKANGMIGMLYTYMHIVDEVRIFLREKKTKDGSLYGLHQISWIIGPHG